MPTDAELLRRYCAERSEAAFAALVQRHLDLVYATALRQLAGDTHLARDIAQQVFTALARKASTLRSHASLAGWLYLGAHHAAAQAVRSEQRRRTREHAAYAMDSMLTEQDGFADWDRVRPLLDTALHALNDADREAVLLRFFEKRPFAEIGAALRVSEDAARMRVDRALEKLRAALQRRGIASTTAALSAALTGPAMVAAPAGLGAAIASQAVAGLGVATATGSALLGGSFMSTPVIITSLAALAAGGFALIQNKQARDAHAETAAARGETASLSVQLRAAEARTEESAEKVTRLTQENTELRQAAVRALSPNTANLATGRPAFTGVTSISTGTLTLSGTIPDGNQLRQAVDTTYSALYRKLGWTDAQREQFASLWVNWKQTGNEKFGELVRASGGKPDREAANAFHADRQKELESLIRASFGDLTVNDFTRFEGSQPLRSLADELARKLFYSETPLSAPQVDRIVDLLILNSRETNGRFDLTTLNRDTFFAQAQALLSPSQLAALRDLEQQRRQRSEALQINAISTAIPDKK